MHSDQLNDVYDKNYATYDVKVYVNDVKGRKNKDMGSFDDNKSVLKNVFKQNMNFSKRKFPNTSKKPGAPIHYNI